MSRSKLFNLVKSRGENKQGRNPFDLSNRHVYTSKAGKIVPIKALHTYPDDYFEVNLSEFSQNNIPMNTAAFLSGKKELLAYFVPYNTIWHNFNQFQATREDPDSTVLKEKGISFEPRIPLYDLYLSAIYFAVGQWIFSSYLDLYTLRSLYLLTNIEEYVGQLTSGMTSAEFIEKCKSSYINGVSVWDYYRNNYYWHFRRDSDWKFSHFAEDTLPLGTSFSCREYSREHDSDLMLFDTYTNMFGNFIWCDWVQKLDMFGYGNIYPILKTMLDDMGKLTDDMLSRSVYTLNGDVLSLSFSYEGETFNLFSDSFLLTSFSGTPLFVDIYQTAVSKLLSMTHYKVSEDDAWKLEYVNLYPIYAYNKCFYEFMRNVYFDNNYSVYNYNCDFINGNTLEGSIISRDDIPLRWYHLESHQWKKDMFTGVLPDNQLGQVSELILNVPEQAVVSDTPNYNALNTSVVVAAGLTQDLKVRHASSNSFISSDGQDIPNGAWASVRTSHTHDVDIPDSNAVLNVLALKRAEAIQQYRQDLMRAGNRTQDVFKQVYGTTPKSQLDECPYFIEVADNDINVNPIISTAQTGQELNGKLGDIAARCTISGKSLSFKFSTKDFGVVIFLSYIVPEAFYNSYRLDPFVTHLDQEAHGLPYFQNLGLQPVLGSFLANIDGYQYRNRTHGFAPPYIERKTDIDLCHGNTVDMFMGENGIIDVNYQGSLSHWVVARTDMQTERTLSLRNFYINPRILDNTFTFNAGDDYETDHFLNYASISIKAVRAFSELGLPRF